MKIITIYFDDYDRPVVDRTAVQDSEAEEVTDRLREVAGEDYVVEVSEPRSVDDILVELTDLMKEDDNE